MIKEKGVESLVNNGNFWFPGSLTGASSGLDLVFNFILIASVILLAGILFAMVYFILAYRKSKKNTIAEKQITHSTKLELTWTILPTIVCLVIFYLGFTGYLKLSIAPENAFEIKVRGQKWNWTFEYPEQGVQSVHHLYVPVGQPIRLTMSAVDVLHSFFIPNLRLKRDVIPNRYTRTWFQADRVGKYHIFCTEYCGDGHSAMNAVLHVLSEEDFENWLNGEIAKNNMEIPLEQLGEQIYSQQCMACHYVDDRKHIGPTWKGLYGKIREFSNGVPAVQADENYLRESIIYPKNKIVKGYPNVMPSYKGLLSDRQIDGIIEYIKTLK